MTTVVDGTMAEIDSFIEKTADERLADYLEFLRIPSIGTLHEHDADTQAAADFLVKRLRKMGFENVEASPTPRHPIVYADWLHAEGAPSDPGLHALRRAACRPALPVEQAALRSVSSRTAASTPGVPRTTRAMPTCTFGPREPWLETQGRLPVNLRIVFEGEEESGSDHFDPWIEANKHRLTADLAMISDTGFFEGNKPAITVGLRGLVLHADRRHGVEAGPALRLVRRQRAEPGQCTGHDHRRSSRMRTVGGRAGLLRRGRRDHATRKNRVRPVSVDIDLFKSDHGLYEVFGEEQFAPLERRGARPTLDVNGIWGGFQGEGSKTIIPAEAHAKISSRLVPDMDPQKTFERVRDYVASIAPPGVKVEVTKVNDGMWSRTSIEDPFVQAAADCLEDVFGERPYYLYEGGSVPAGATFSRVLGLPVLLLGFTQPDDQAHAPNESMRLDNYEGGLRTLVRYWQKLGAGATAD